MMQKYQTLRLNNLPHLSKKIREKGLVDKSNISGFRDNSDLDWKIAILSTKTESKAVQDKKKKKQVQAFDSSYFQGKSNFEDDSTQYYLVLQPVYRYFKKSISI